LRGANILLAPLVRGGGGRARTVHFHVEFPVLLAQRAAELGVLDVDLDGVIHGPGDVTHGGVRGSRARGCDRLITPIKVFKFSKKLMRSVGHFPKRHPSQRCLHYPFGARQNAPRSDYPAWSRHTRALPNLR
jgi:hypothetical protein